MLASAAAAKLSVIHLKDGDQIRGQILGTPRKAFRLKTLYGLLLIPREKVLRVVHDDGREEWPDPSLQPTPAPASTPTPEPRVRLEIAVTGASFWYAWAEAPTEPRLRLSIALNGTVVAEVEDATLDPGEIPGAMVNTFAWLPDQVSLSSPPEILARLVSTSGRASLLLDLPAWFAGAQTLSLAYSRNDSSSGSPHFEPAASGELRLELRASDRSRRVEVRQERGQMEFSGLLKKRMKRVESFAISVRSLEPAEP